MNSFNSNRNLSYFPAVGGVDIQSIMRSVYSWMVLGMLITAGFAYITVSTTLINFALNPIILIVAMLAELGLVMGIGFAFNKISAGTAAMMFFVYAALNGFTLSIILLTFSLGSVFLAFVSTAALFGAMSIIGYTTKIDLSKMGTFLMMGVIGLLIAMVINIFVASGPLDFIISILGVLIFTGLTAFDTQRIARMAGQMNAQGDSAAKFGIFGSLRLYLDFINMFLFMLRLFGRRR
jgi:uncharacterized protein